MNGENLLKQGFFYGDFLLKVCLFSDSMEFCIIKPRRMAGYEGF